MAFELRQNLKLTQQLIMTPQLQQAIKLLQMSRLDLVDAVNQEMEENPLLEEIVSDEMPEVEAKIEQANGEDAPSEGAAVVRSQEELTGEGDGREEFDWDGYLEDYAPSGSSSVSRNEESAPLWETTVAGKTSLTDHLMWQLMLSQFTEEERRAGEQIIGNIDEKGYLAASLEEIAAGAKTTPALVEEVLKKVQEFDPPGIAARDLSECLLNQARLAGDARFLVEQIILHHLDDLKTRNYDHIAKKLKESSENVNAAVKIISNMDPHPGSGYNEERIEAIVPDVYVIKSGDDYKVLLNEDGVPRLRISNYYREITSGGGGETNQNNGRRYIKERMQSASWLIKSIQQRQRTIRRVAESIVRFQRDFFDRGIDALKPLILRDVADELEMHESTISRVVTNKYMHSPQGMFELKFFFGSGIHKAGCDDISSKSVQEEIKKMIASEDPRKPLSDEKIAGFLEASGLTIARRTIAKYRDIMGVLPSSMRKKYQ
ncbi:MAG: RNA polymerase factor sigma-54 [Syntrophales bacterium]